MRTIRFKNDTRLRNKLFVSDAMSHPAKGHIGMWQQIVEEYTQEGDTILDPMAGIGTSLVAALMGRNVICVELESHFVEPMKASWEKMKQQPMLGHTLGTVEIHMGDARDLSFLGEVDGIVTSPPYADSPTSSGLGSVNKDDWGNEGTDIAKRRNLQVGYTRPDAIVTSPPFQDQEATKAGKFADPVKAAQIQSDNYRSGSSKGHYASPEAILRAMDRVQPYAPSSTENIGNLRSAAYWEAMKQVYSEAFRILKPSGVMVLVLKGFTRDGQYVDLPLQTQKLVESLGFEKFDHWRRELWTLSFWRILQQRRDPEAFDDRLRYEEVLAFRKGEGDGLVEAVISSPPYEGSITPESDGIDWLKSKDMDRSAIVSRVKGGSGRARGYTRQVSAVITSPPYEGSIQTGETPDEDKALAREARAREKHPERPVWSGYTRRKPS